MKGATVPATRIVIGRVDRIGHETVIHVSLTNVPVPENIAPGQQQITIAHSPFSEEAMANSVDALERGSSPEIAGFEDAYATWAAEEDAAIYTITAAESITQIFAALQQS